MDEPNIDKESTPPRIQLEHPFRALVLFFILAFAITWAFLISAIAYVPERSQSYFISLAAFGPFISAVITPLIFAGWPGLRNWLRRVFSFRAPILISFRTMFLRLS